MVQLRNVVCREHVGQHSLSLQRQTTGIMKYESRQTEPLHPQHHAQLHLYVNCINKQLVKEQTLPFSAEVI